MTNTPKPAPRFFFDPNQGAIYDRTRNGKRVQTDYTFTPTSLCSLLNELFPPLQSIPDQETIAQLLAKRFPAAFGDYWNKPNAPAYAIAAAVLTLFPQPPQSSNEMPNEAFLEDRPERQAFNQWAGPMVVDKDGETGEVAAVVLHDGGTP